jgi:glycosyltransferase involved in cell wall biosynthesis
MEAIDSALNQTYEPIEIIVVDDGSTDSSREIIANYGNKIISVYKNQGGEASALNAGFKVSSGELICLLDSDDVWLPTKVEQIVETAFYNPEAALIYHQVQPVDEKKIFINEPHPSFILSGWIEYRVSHSGGWWHFPGSSGLTFKKSFIERSTPIPELDYRISADAYLADLAPFCGKVIGLKQVLAFYRLHDNNNYWTTAVESKEVVVRSRIKSYENRVFNLNKSLNKLGLDKQVSLKDQYTYRKYKYLIGDENNIIELVLTGLKFPVEHPLKRIQDAIQLILRHLSKVLRNF